MMRSSLNGNSISDVNNNIANIPTLREMVHCPRLFSALSKEDQATRLNYYREKIFSANPIHQPSAAIYFRCAGLYSLKALTSAILEMRPDIPLQLPGMLLTTANNKNETQVDQLALNALRHSAPLYYKNLMLKLSCIEKDKKRTIGINNMQMEEISPDQHALFTRHVIAKDNATLLALIREIEIFMYIPRAHRITYSLTYRSAAIAIPILIMLSWIIPLIVMAVMASRQDSKYEAYEAAAVYIGVGGCLFLSLGTGLFSYFCSRRLWRKEVEQDISCREWADLQKNIQQNVMDNLKRLEKMQKKTHESLLPINDEMNRELKNEVAKLNYNHTYSEAYRIFNRLNGLLRSVSREMNKTQRPLSLLFNNTDVDLETGPPLNNGVEYHPAV